MAEIQKPSDINKIWASSGDVLAPSDSKIATGWQVEIPPRQYFNYIDNKQDQAIAHINQHGISVWDSATEYQYSSSGSKSLCMGSNGVIYRAKQVNTNQNPVTDTTNAYWETAFASVSDVYSKTDADAKYSQRFANLSDLGNTAASRTNLSVYSKAETYTQSQIDAKTTVASALQAQAQTSDTTLITPLKLAASFQGANQLLSANGFQTYPGGFTHVWGSNTGAVPATVGSFIDITIPHAKNLSNIYVTLLTQGGDPAEATEMVFSVYTQTAAQTVVRVKRLSGSQSGPPAELTKINLLIMGLS